MVGRGRPAVGERVDCRYPAATLAALDALAKRKGMSRAAAMRAAIDEYIEKHGETNK